MNDDPTPTNNPAASGFDLGKVVEMAKAVITNPRDFYRNMPTSGGFAEPSIFAAVMGLVAGAIIAVLSIIGLGGPGGATAGVMALIFMPIFAVLFSFIAGLIAFVIWKLMGSSKDYEAAYRCMAFSTGIYPITAVLSVVPYIGTIISTVWALYLMFIASTEVHKIARQTATIVVIVLGSLLLISQISGEIAARKLEAQLEESTGSLEDLGKKWGEAMEKSTKDGEEMSPEEAGRAIGEFFKGMSEAVDDGKGSVE